MLLIDEEGRIRNSGPATRMQLCSSGDSPLSHPLMCEQGCVLVAAGEATLKIDLCPAHIRERTLSALMYWLADQRVERVVLAILDGAWLHEVLPTRRLAQRRIVGLVSAARCNREGRFLTRPVGFASLEPGHPMLALIAECGAGLNKSRVADILRNGFRDRFTAVRVQRGSGELIVADMGAGYYGYSDAQRQSLIGARVEDQPDYDYGRWVASSYRKRIERGQPLPLVEDVDVLVAWPQGGPVRHRYRRLIVPATRGEEAWLLSASLEDADIDLRGTQRCDLEIVEDL